MSFGEFYCLSNDELISLEGGNLFGDICKAVTQVAVGAIVGSAFTVAATPAAGYAAAALAYEAVGAAWDAIFKN